MGILSSLAFWRKKPLPNLPEEDYSQEFSPLEVPREKPYLPETPTYSYPPIQQLPTNELQVISSKLDVLNSKIEVLNEKITNLERSFRETKRW